MTKKDHLMADLLANGIPLVTLNGPDDGPSDQISPVYQDGVTQDQIVTAQAIINAFDWSDVAHGNWILSMERLLQIDKINDIQNMVLRAIVKLTVDQLNLMRGDVVAILEQQFNPNNLTNGSGQTTSNITIVGAQLGDVIEIGAPVSLAGVFVFGWVVAADTVQVRFHNLSGGTINLADGIWRLIVRRPVARPPITMSQAKAAIMADIASGNVDS